MFVVIVVEDYSCLFVVVCVFVFSHHSKEYSLKEDSLMETQDISCLDGVNISEDGRNSTNQEEDKVDVTMDDVGEEGEEMEEEEGDEMDDEKAVKMMATKGGENTEAEYGQKKSSSSKSISHNRRKNLTK